MLCRSYGDTMAKVTPHPHPTHPHLLPGAAARDQADRRDSGHHRGDRGQSNNWGPHSEVPPPHRTVHTVLHPTNNALLLNFRLSSDAEIFVAKHRPEHTDQRQTCKKRVCNVYVFRLGFHFCVPLSVVGQAKMEDPRLRLVKEEAWVGGKQVPIQELSKFRPLGKKQGRLSSST